jgi:hypothetical protein
MGLTSIQVGPPRSRSVGLKSIQVSPPRSRYLSPLHQYAPSPMPAHLSARENADPYFDRQRPTPSDHFIHPVDHRSGIHTSSVPIFLRRIPDIPLFKSYPFERVYGQQAIKLLQLTKFQIGIPDPQLQVDDVQENKHLRMYKHIALLLQFREHRDVVTAVTMSVQLGVRDPIFELIHAKNKGQLQEGDIMRGEELV